MPKDTPVSSIMPAGRGDRPLVHIEQAREILNRITGASNIMIVSRVRGPLTAELMRPALDLLQQRHPRLRSRIEGPNEDLRFVGSGAQPIPLRFVRETREGEWVEVVEAELNQRLDSDKCLARVTVVQPLEEGGLNALITVMHHAISDGLSVLYRHPEIISYCARLAAGEKIEVQSLPFLPSLDALMPAEAKGWPGRLRTAAFLWNMRYQIWRQKPQAIEIDRQAPVQQRRCGLIHRTVELETTRGLMAMAQREKASVHGAASAAMLFATARHLLRGERKPICVTCRSSVDLRRRLKPRVDMESMGLVASSLLTYHPVRPETRFWSLAGDVMEKLGAGFKRGDMFWRLAPTTKVATSYLNRPAPMTTLILDCGRMRFPPSHGPFTIEEIGGTAAQVAFGGVLGLGILEYQKRLILHFMFSMPAMSREKAGKLVDETMACLQRASREDFSLL